MDPAEGEDIASKQQRSEEAEAAKRPPEAGQISGEPVIVTTPEKLPAPRAPAPPSGAAASSRSSSLSPQPSLELHNGMPLEEQELDLPGRAASAAQAAASAAHEEESWQEVKPSRRKPVSQQAAFKTSARKVPKQSRGASDQQAPALSQARPREQHVPAQHAAQASLKTDKANGRTHAHPVQVAAMQLPHLPLASASNVPQQPPHHEGPDSLQLHPHVPPVSKQQKPLQATADDSVSHRASNPPHNMPHVSPRN